jgi:predicted chitinase
VADCPYLGDSAWLFRVKKKISVTGRECLAVQSKKKKSMLQEEDRALVQDSHRTGHVI